MGTLIMFDLVQDVLVYACFVAGINMSIFYFKSAGADAPGCARNCHGRSWRPSGSTTSWK